MKIYNKKQIFSITIVVNFITVKYTRSNGINSNKNNNLRSVAVKEHNIAIYLIRFKNNTYFYLSLNNNSYN